MTPEKLFGDLLQRGLELLQRDERGQALLRELGASLIHLGTVRQETRPLEPAHEPPEGSEPSPDPEPDYSAPIVYFSEEDLPDFDLYKDMSALNVIVLDELLLEKDEPSDTLRSAITKNIELHREIGAYYSLHRAWHGDAEQRKNLRTLRDTYQTASRALELLEYFYFEPEVASKELVHDIAAAMAMLRVAAQQAGRFSDHVQRFMFNTLLEFVKREHIFVVDYMRRDFVADLSDLAEVTQRIEAGFKKLLSAHIPGTKSRAVTHQHQVQAVHEFADFLRGKRLLLIGGEVYNHVFERLEAAFQCNLIWCEVSKTGYKNYEASVSHPDTDLVLFATRWASHAAFYEVKELCVKYGKTFVQLPGGYGVNQIAHQISVQALAKPTATKNLKGAR
jgi:hypothetical protein